MNWKLSVALRVDSVCSICDRGRFEGVPVCWETAGLVLGVKKRKLLLGGLLDITVHQINA